MQPPMVHSAPQLSRTAGRPVHRAPPIFELGDGFLNSKLSTIKEEAGKLKAEERLVEKAEKSDKEKLEFLKSEEAQLKKLPESDAVQKLQSQVSNEEKDLQKIVNEQDAEVKTLKAKLSKLEAESIKER